MEQQWQLLRKVWNSCPKLNKERKAALICQKPVLVSIPYAWHHINTSSPPVPQVGVFEDCFIGNQDNPPPFLAALVTCAGVETSATANPSESSILHWCPVKDWP